MRFLYFGQYEFAYPDSEECLYVTIAKPREFAWVRGTSDAGSRNATEAESLQAFLNESEQLEAHFEKQLPAARSLVKSAVVPLNVLQTKATVCKYLRDLAKISIEVHDPWPVYIFHQEWDDNQYLLVAPQELIWYHWYTTA